jgi:hypothetical protein
MDALTGKDREVRITLAPPFPAGRAEEVVLRAPDGVAIEDFTTASLRTLLDEGARILEVRRGESLERRYFAGDGAP